LRGSAGHVAIAADHALIVAVGRVLGRLQESVRAQALSGPLELDVEVEQPGQRLGVIGKLAAKLVVAGNLLFPCSEARLPRRVAGKQAV
jgi:hypothetical protein